MRCDGLGTKFLETAFGRDPAMDHVVYIYVHVCEVIRATKWSFTGTHVKPQAL